MLFADSLGSPAVFPFAPIDASGFVPLVTLSEADYLSASFLDGRVVPRAGINQTTSVHELCASVATLTAECDFIFHTGHVGSTLLSRVLGMSSRIFSVREPEGLRPLASRAPDAVSWDGVANVELLEVYARLYARVWRPSERALVKTTSFVSDLGPSLLQIFGSASAILMFAPPGDYMCTMLSGSATRADLRPSASGKFARLHRLLGGEFWAVDDLTDGELAAAGWVVEICALAHIAKLFPERTRWFDLQLWLADVRAGLSACLEFLHGHAPADMVEKMATSVHFGQYSKAPEFSFDVADRTRIITEAAVVHRHELDRGIAWLNAAGRRHPVIAESVRAAATGRTVMKGAR